MKRLLALAALLLGLASAAQAEMVTGVIMSGAKASNVTKDIDVGSYERFSVQVDLADSELSASSFSGGAPATMTVTVADFAGLRGQLSSATVTLVSGMNTALAIGDETITVKGKRFTEGVHWSRDVVYATNTARNLAQAIDAHWEWAATVSSNVITVWALSSGTAANSWAISSSSPTALSVTAWGGGQDYGYLSLAGVTLTEGTNFTAVTSSHVTANSIAVAINANSTLSALVSVSSSPNGANLGFLTINTLVNGSAEYPVAVSNVAHLTPNKNKLDGGAASDVNISGDYISETAHGFPTGLQVVYSTGSNLTIGGLSHGSTYYVIARDANSYKLATSAGNADAGTAIDLTSAANATFSLTPLVFASAATDGIKWQGSNDGSSFYDLSSTSVPYTADGGAVVSFTDYPYRYLRLNFTKPTTGALNVTATFSGRR